MGNRAKTPYLNFAQYILSRVATVSKNECATLEELNKESDSSKEKIRKELEKIIARRKLIQ